jgi:hypothetical protein
MFWKGTKMGIIVVRVNEPETIEGCEKELNNTHSYFTSLYIYEWGTKIVGQVARTKGKRKWRGEREGPQSS